MELSCGRRATTARYKRNDTTGATKVPPRAALRAVRAPPRDGRPGSWSDWLGRKPASARGYGKTVGRSTPPTKRCILADYSPRHEPGRLGSAVKRGDKPIHYHPHAELRLRQRGVDKSQVAKTLRSPDSERPARRPGATRFEKALSKRRRLAVIALDSRDSFLVLSAFWI